MPEIAYRDKSFTRASMAIIDTARTICADYRRQGFDLTLRQLYYQFVARGYLANRDTEYKRLGNIVNDARLAGLLDWNYIVDRTRNLRALPHWNTPGSVIDSAAYGYQTDRWANQHHRVEVWIEKDALVGVIAGVCNRMDVPFFSCRGYTSQSELWGAAQRLIRYERSGHDPIVIHLGDHDPSGIDMTRDIGDRLALFGAHTTVRRIALNMDQVQAYRPPPNPAKLTDARANGYITRYGRESWELDALDPASLDALIAATIGDYLDTEQWQADTNAMEADRALLTLAAGRWAEVAEYLETVEPD